MFVVAVEAPFTGERARRLWRVDVFRGQTYLLLFSSEKPELPGVQAQFGFPDQPWETKDHQPLMDRIGTESQ